MTVTIYHNPRCSKSRQTLELLRDRGIEPAIIEYLKTPPDAATLEDILQKLNLEPRALMRRGETAYAEAGLANPELDRSALIAATSNGRSPSPTARPPLAARQKTFCRSFKPATGERHP